MKVIKKLAGLIVLLLLMCLFFTGCKDKKESEIPTDFKHTKNTEEFESNSTIAEGKELIKQEDFSAEGEKVLFGFQVADSKKIMSICTAEDESYIVYRFGTRDNIELEFPEDRENSFSYFNYSYYLRGGGLENAGLDFDHFNFSNGDYQYQVYSEYEAETGIRAVGIRVTDEKTGKETDITGDSNSVIGSMIPFREMEKIIVNFE
ncbi:hypothetical protein CIW83_01880 [Tissierella sp. P1]|uniref:hypothetical protein n=1 Tax=Tissierella sp. P1 TaxID=1280483 RepID=UPI000B9FAAB8|nr:hypothetical protein [Tissierella sp. P1]OZV13713.1 hypothetical protein CIW83_01880 [Tissierella sp. P1]